MLALECAPPEFRFDCGVVLAAVAQNGRALVHASEMLGADRAVVLAAVATTGLALEFVQPAFRNDHGVLLAAVSQDGSALAFASGWNRVDPEILTAAVSENRRALMNVSRPLRAPRYLRAGPVETRLLFRHMPYPFYLPEDLVAAHILPRCHRW